MEEVWKVFKDTRIRKNGRPHSKGALWEVSDQGNVKKNGVLFECRLNCGYKFFGHGYSVHRAVAILFIPNPDNKPCVDHINTNPLDNRVINLRWVTPKENNNNPITKRRQSEARKGRPKSEEHRKKLSESMKGKNTGSRSEEHRKHLGEAHLNTHRVYHGDGTWHMEKNL